ncbi:4Fe-4S dicluster domain-containing protein [Acetonema longum]|uniref:4Fe-4S ferredoxin, iron-sulfur binding protein n=1 Tax=Acetonema longum DSM 6540 TaxID=1009370 RepID=F7NJR7_9FIRM|nr:4Fe-4S ferredoxin, iron-sulfur binding protein [Acetonema longum DSM 6540]
MQFGFIIDPSRCIGCRACEKACRKEKDEPFPLRTVQLVVDKGKKHHYFISMSCNHCENPECFRVCPEKSYTKRRDGVVVHQTGRCTGCSRCVKACPFGAPRFNPQTGKVDKCDLCIEHISMGRQPLCVLSCPTKALQVVSDITDHGLPGKIQFPGAEGINLTHPSLRIREIKRGEAYFL